MPLMTVSAVWASRVDTNVGSSSASLLSEPEIFCSSPRLFGVTASEYIGCGHAVTARNIGADSTWSTSPRLMSSTFARAIMSPATAFFTSWVSLPWILNKCPTFAVLRSSRRW